MRGGLGSPDSTQAQASLSSRPFRSGITASVTSAPRTAATNPVTNRSLTVAPDVGIFANVRAELVVDFRDVAEDGSIIQMTIWRVPKPVAPSAHRLKYRLVYVVDGVRVVGFDNERGKGDHCHLDGRERAYRFTTLEQLIDDFIREVDKRRAR